MLLVNLKDKIMKVLQSSVFRSICSIAVGAMLIKNPDSTVKGITIAIGLLFLVSGVISCVAYFNARLHSAENEVYDVDGKLLVGGKPMFPVVGLGSVILGFVLALMPGAFVTSLMYVLGGILLLGSLNQFLVLIQARKYAVLPLWFWVCPTLIIGWCLLFYGVTECLNAFKIHQCKKRMLRKSGNELEGEQSSAQK